MRPQRQYTKRITRAASRSENADSEATPDKAFEHYNDENIDPNADNQLQSTISDQQQSMPRAQTNIATKKVNLTFNGELIRSVTLTESARKRTQRQKQQQSDELPPPNDPHDRLEAIIRDVYRERVVESGKCK
ncbi:hypothetical protein PMZ80_010143 [Knufia obscura]|uniref:Uncharacterized protein n=2 Tax=Knufia TaxID=430999 RepID=A0AAN8EJK1_9EURO|nr:hypothetical protein PMZ80_010143 [Knufia obscura]KAK5952883.1 hypothetical protein OHC33_006004 [Knufia fluminis]